MEEMIPVKIYYTEYSSCFQWVLSDRVIAAATAFMVKAVWGRAGGDPSRGVGAEALADPCCRQTHSWTLPPQEEDHGQPVYT